MKQQLKKKIKAIPQYGALRNWWDHNTLRKWWVRRIQQREIHTWQRNGKPVPPPHIVKQQTLETYARRFELRILVETGTFYGHMIEAMKDIFDTIYSIELSEDLYQKATDKFNGIAHINLIQGDSGVELKRVLKKIHQPALFWLDGHYSGGETARGDKDTPIYEELGHILSSPERGHVIIIDDARCFVKDPAYPSISEIIGFVTSLRPDSEINIQDDSIRIIPPKESS